MPVCSSTEESGGNENKGTYVLYAYQHYPFKEVEITIKIFIRHKERRIVVFFPDII